MKTYVKYIENCSNEKLKEFDTKDEAAKWVANFKLKYQNHRNETACWIELVFTGKVIYDGTQHNL